MSMRWSCINGSRIDSEGVVGRGSERKGKVSMNRAETDKLLQALSESPAEGVSLMSLARSTGKSLPELQKFLRAHRDCFTETGQTKYKLNPGPPISGCLERAQLQLQLESSKKRKLQLLRWVGVSAAMFIAFYLLTGFV